MKIFEPAILSGAAEEKFNDGTDLLLWPEPPLLLGSGANDNFAAPTAVISNGEVTPGSDERSPTHNPAPLNTLPLPPLSLGTEVHFSP